MIVVDEATQRLLASYAVIHTHVWDSAAYAALSKQPVRSTVHGSPGITAWDVELSLASTLAAPGAVYIRHRSLNAPGLIESIRDPLRRSQTLSGRTGDELGLLSVQSILHP